MKKKDELEHCLKMLERCNKAHTALNDHQTEAIKYYEAQELELGKGEKKGLSKTVVPTLSDAVNWAMPILLEIFASGDETYYIKPRGGEDAKKTDKLSVIVDYQTRVKNNWFLFCHDWIQDSLIARIGWAKYQWYKNIEYIEKEYESLTIMELREKLNTPNTEIISHEEHILTPAQIDPATNREISPSITEHDIKLKYKIEDEYPLLEAIPRENIGTLPNVQDIKTTPFVWHRVTYDEGNFKKKFGNKIFNKVENFKKDYNSLDHSGVEYKRFEDLGGVSFLYDEKNGIYNIYECYYNNLDTGEAWITKLCGEEILTSEKNEYDYPPFECIAAFRLSHKMTGYSMHDLLKKFQELSTALMRNLLNNIYINNQGRYLVDGSGRVNLDDFKNNNVPGGYIRVKSGGLENAVQPLIPPMLQPWAFDLYERVERMIEYRSGVPRAYKGVDVGKLNKTFRGQNAQIYQASQIIKMMARLMGEMGFVPLIKDIIRLDQKFLKKKTAIRVLNEDVDISPDDTIVQADVIINVGLGTNNKDMIVMQMQQLLGIFKMIYEAKLPVVSAQNVYNALAELIKAMGFKNKNDFITDPKFMESIQTLIMALMKYAPALAGMGIPIPPEIQQSMQKIMVNMGMMGEMQKTTQPKNIEQPATTQQPGVNAQPMHPIMTGDGGGHFG